jgi:hypothetical protein
VGQCGVVGGSGLGSEKVARCVRKLQLVLQYISCGASFEGMGGIHMGVVGIVQRSYGEYECQRGGLRGEW